MNQFSRKASVLVAGVMSLAILSNCGGDDNNNNDALLLLALQPPASSGSNPTIVGSPAAVTTARGATVASSSAGNAASQAAGVTPSAMQAELMASMAQIKAAAQPAAALSWTNQEIALSTTPVSCNYWPGATKLTEISTPTVQGSFVFRTGSKIVMNGTYNSTSTGSYPNTSSTLDADYTMTSDFVVDFTDCGVTAFDVNSLAAWDGKYTTIPVKSLVITGDVTFQGTSTRKQQGTSTMSLNGSIYSSESNQNSQFSSQFTSSSTAMKVANTPAELASATASTSSLTGSGSGTQVTNTKTVMNTDTYEYQDFSMLMNWSTTETVKGTVNGENVEITIPMTLSFSCSSLSSCTM